MSIHFKIEQSEILVNCMVDTKIIFDYNFVVPLRIKTRSVYSKIKVYLVKFDQVIYLIDK